MLVLSRKEDDSIMIGDNIRVIVVRAKKDGQVRIGIEAPKDVPVWRGELYEQMLPGKQQREVLT